MDVEYQNCSTELVAPDVASCGDVTTEDLSFSEDIERPSEEMQGGETEMVLNLTQGDQLAGRLFNCKQNIFWCSWCS